jgi:hypothetical protein
VGPLFQGRFKAVLHEPSTQALVINRYIHLNPVRISRLGGLGSSVADTFKGARQRSAFRGALCSSTPFGPRVTRIGAIGRRHGVSHRDHGQSTPGVTIEVRQRPCQESAACLKAVVSAS